MNTRIGSPKMVSLFSGCGGLDKGFIKAGFDIVWANDFDSDAQAIHKLNLGEIDGRDILTVPEADIPDCEIICAGFPCQPFSIAGKRMGFSDSRGTMFFEVARILKYTKPKIAFLENVSGIVSHDSGRTLKVIKNTLEEIGYVVNYKVMNAKDYGIPQNRNRWYCVAIRKDIYNKEFKFPNKKSLKFTVDQIIDPKVKGGYDSTEIALANINKHIEKFKTSERFKKGSKNIIANEIRASKCNFRNDGISPCLTAKMGTGGNNIPVIVNYKRKLTEKECLKIMGFPETYKIKENNMQSYKQIGNSVVVPIIKDIGEKIIEYL